jgi:hypothetical protein
MGSSRKGEVEPSAAIETRLLPWAVTFTTGVRPRRPQVRPLGGLRPWPDSSSKQSQAPRSAAVLLSRARSPPATRRWWPPRPARRPGGPGPGRSSRSGGAPAGGSGRRRRRDHNTAGGASPHGGVGLQEPRILRRSVRRVPQAADGAVTRWGERLGVGLGSHYAAQVHVQI